MEIAGRVTKQPPERFDWLFTKRDAYHDPNMLPDLAALQRNVDMTRDLGFVKSALDVKKQSRSEHRRRGGEATEVTSGTFRQAPARRIGGALAVRYQQARTAQRRWVRSVRPVHTQASRTSG